MHKQLVAVNIEELADERKKKKRGVDWSQNAGLSPPLETVVSWYQLILQFSC